MKENIRVNVVVNLIRTFVLTLLSFITFPWVCRYLGDSVLGQYTWALTFVSYFLILAKIGIPNLALRECVKVRDNKELLSNRAQMFFILQLITTLVSFALMCVLVFSITSLRDSKALIFILSLNFLTGAFSFEWIFIALEKQFYMSVRSIAVLTISAILIIIFVTTPNDVYIYSFATISVTAATTIANLFYIRKYISFKKTLPYDYKSIAKPLLVISMVAISLSLYNQTDTFILGFIDQSKTEVGSYSVGIKGIDIVIGVLANLSTVFNPRSNYYYQKEDKRFFHNLNRYSMNIALFIVIPAMVLMGVLSVTICALISGNYDLNLNTGEFVNSYVVLIILVSMMLTYSISEMIYGNILIPMKKEKFYLYAIGGGTILNIVLSIVLGIFVFKSNPCIGIAIGTSVTDLFVLIYLLSITWKYSSKAIFNKNSLKLLIAGVIMLGITLAISNPIYIGLSSVVSASWAMVIQLLAVFIIGATIYVVACLILKEDLVYSFIRKKPKEI